MAQRIVHVPWDQQPQELSPVDPDHPLGRALDAAWVGNDLGGTDVLKGHKVALLSATTIGRTTRGNAFTHTGTAGSLVAVPGEAALPYVQIGYGYFNTAGGAWQLSRLGNSAGGYESRLALASSTTVAADVRWNFGTSRNLTITLPTTLNTPICMALVAYSSTDYRFFANGQQQNGTLSPGTFASLDRMYAPGDTLNGGLWFTGFGSGASLSDEELLRITANPEAELWSMFRRRIWVPVGAAGGAQTVAIGQAVESDAAQAFTATAGTIAAIGQASETDAAQAFVATQRKAIGQAAEVDTAQAFAPAQRKAIGQAAETDAAQALAASQRKAIGQAAEADTAQAIAYSAPGTVGQALETDAAQPFAAKQSRAIGQASETDAAQPITASTGTAVAIGLALEIDTAGAFAALGPIAIAIGQAQEVDLARAMTSIGGGASIDPAAIRRVARSPALQRLARSPALVRSTNGL